MRFGVTAIAALMSVTSAWGQTVPVSEEGARVSERFQKSGDPGVSRRSSIVLQATEPPRDSLGITLNVRSVTVRGTTVYRPDELLKTTAAIRGRTSIAAIYALAQQLTSRYADDGYVLSRVVVPPQDLDPDGAEIVLQAVEGYVDEVRWPDAVFAYRDLFSSYEAKIKADRPVNIRTIERYLLLANDLPGLAFESRLEPSRSNTAAATLVVEMKEKPVDLFFSADNRGTEGRGPYQYVASANINNRLGLHERFTGTWAGSFQTRELQYLSARSEWVLNSEGLTLGLGVEWDSGKPGVAALEAIQFESRSLSFSGDLRWPVIRSREQNLDVTATIFSRDSISNALGARLNEDRLRGVRLGLSYELLDRWDGITETSLTFSQGFDGLGSTGNGNPLASRANGRVDFSKLEARLARNQPLAHGFSVYGQAEGQLAGTPLLAAEECTYGGGNYGRAFDPSALAGDHCLKLSGELRYDASLFDDVLSQSQVFGFVDFGQVWRIAPGAGVSASESASSAGAGLRVAWDENVFGNVEVSRRLHGDIGRGDWQVYFGLASRY